MQKKTWVEKTASKPQSMEEKDAGAITSIAFAYTIACVSLCVVGACITWSKGESIWR